MIFCCIHRLVAHSFRDASFCSKWEQRQRATANVLGTHSSKWNVAIKSIPSELKEPNRMGGGDSVRARKDGEHQKNKSLRINWPKLIWTPRPKQQAQSYTALQQVLCVYIIAFSLVFFMRLLSVCMSESLILVPDFRGSSSSGGLPYSALMW